ncbi:MAG: hypothetical protein GXP15_00040 [Gammaproteobacteria bacterium]|nr:hypothetical protein [Gammaproteobacteria bacterium]
MSRPFFLASVVLLLVGRATTAFSEVTAPDEWHSFDFYNEQYILVRGTVNGHATDMLLDTGAQISLIDKSYARRVGVRRGKKLNVRGVGGRTKSYAAKNIEVSAGEFSLDLDAVALMDLSVFGLVTGRPINFILGSESLEDIVVDIDYPNRRIAFRSAKDFEYAGSGHTVPVKALKRGRHAIRATIENTEPGWYLIDTGNASSAMVFAAFARDQQILQNRALISESVSGGISGIIRETITSVGRFTIGGFELNDMPIEVPAENEGRQTSEDFDGLLGNEVLSRFRVIFDYSRGQIHLEPAADWNDREFSRSLMGLAALPQGDQLKVIFVSPGSPAERAGWEKGMFVSVVDQLSGTGVELQARLRELSKGAAGSRIMMLDENGVERTVILARFY